MRDVVYVDEFLQELKKDYPFARTVDFDHYICKTRKLSATDLIEELVSRYDGWIEDRDKEIGKLEKRVAELTAYSNKMNEERAQAKLTVLMLKDKLKKFADDISLDN